MPPNAAMGLSDTLNALRLVDLKVLVKNFEIDDVQLSATKEKMIAQICSSPSLEINAELMERVKRIGEYFLSGGKGTLTLFRVQQRVQIRNFDDLCQLVRRSPSTMIGATEFRLVRIRQFHFHGNTYFVVEYQYPGSSRQVEDYNHGYLAYTPILTAECILRCGANETIFDIRCPSAVAKDFSLCISKVLWGNNDYGQPRYIPLQVQLNHSLAMRLKEKFDARSFQIKVTEADELDEGGRFHPTCTEFISRGHDLTSYRDALSISPSAEDQAHGLQFEDEFEGIVMDGGCRVCLNYPSGQVSFKKTTTFGAYDKVINAILEFQQ